MQQYQGKLPSSPTHDICDTCRPHGVSGVSECTQDFLGASYIHLHSARQVLIPDIVMAALQSGYSLLNGKESPQHIYTELQV